MSGAKGWPPHRRGLAVANIDREQAIESLADRVGLSSARQIVLTLDKGIERLETNVNARLLAEVLLLDWPR